MSGSFQTQVQVNPAFAVQGDFASANPRTSVLAGQFAFVANPVNPPLVARWGWIDSTNTLVSNSGVGAPAGFIGRQGNQAYITAYLGAYTFQMLAGMPVTLYNEGEFWVLNSGTNEVVPNMKAYANNGNGTTTFGATGTAPTAASVTAAVTQSTGSFTGTITDNVLSITVVGSGTAVVGGTLSGTGVTTGTMISSQLSGTAGGAGTYLVSIPGQAVTSTTISETYGTMTVSAVGSGSLGVGQVLSGTGVTANTYIAALGTGTGGTGTYVVTPNTAVSSTTITATGGTETKWYAANYAAAGELVRMTSWPRG
jgi:hypothetical protein